MLLAAFLLNAPPSQHWHSRLDRCEKKVPGGDTVDRAHR